MNQDTLLYQSVGGKLISHSVLDSSDPVWHFGWVPPDFRGDSENEIHDQNINSMQPFGLSSSVDDDVKRTYFGKLWSHPRVIQALGMPYTGTHQLTGSCVGVGAANAMNTLNFIETIILGQPEEIFLVFPFYHYGRGRLASGMRSRGDGSTGSGQAKAIERDGVAYNRDDMCPKPVSTSDGIVWGKAVEMQWSDGDSSPCVDYLPFGKKHLVTEVVRLRNHDEVRKALIAAKVVTAASMLAFRARVEGEGQDAVLLGRHEGKWLHQMTLMDYWDHPRFGPLFWDHNQWGLKAHGVCPSGQPAGGAWITADMVDYQCKDEVFAFFGFNGRSVPTIDWERV